ncbi:hypothetical protein [Arthrobacter sp. Z1-15]
MSTVTNLANTVIRKTKMKRWMLLALMLTIVVALYVWLGFSIAEHATPQSHKAFIAVGTVITTLGALIGALGSTEPWTGKRAEGSSKGLRDSAKSWGVALAFGGGFFLSLISIMDAIGKFSL